MFNIPFAFPIPHSPFPVLVLRAAIDRFLRSTPLNKPFFINSDSAVTEANKVLEPLQKPDLRKTGNITDVVHMKPIFNEQMKRLFDSGELGPAKNKNPSQLQRTTKFYLGLFFSLTRTRKD